MKNLVILFALLYAPVIAQITLEKTYDVPTDIFKVAQVDSNEFVYENFNGHTYLKIYDLDHQLLKNITLPDSAVWRSEHRLYYLSKYLFNLDDKYEFLVVGHKGPSSGLYQFIRIYNEENTILFNCDSCVLTYTNNPSPIYEGVYHTSRGAKMIIFRHDPSNVYAQFPEVYSLPGKLPYCNTKLSVTDAPTIISSSSPSTSAYPNPSNGKIRVAYSLPEGVTTGELVITTTDGREVKRYRVGNMFNDILIEKSELASGVYFYKLITERGESEARKFVITQ